MLDGKDRTWTRIKTMLTRAERSGNPDNMLAAVAEAERLFEEHGWPDWWSRIERMRQDAELAKRYSREW